MLTRSLQEINNSVKICYKIITRYCVFEPILTYFTGIFTVLPQLPMFFTFCFFLFATLPRLLRDVLSYIILLMDAKRDLTKELLADCFKKLLARMPFAKITIRMITDEAGLIRPTFYKHFQDKYEVVEWIFMNEIAAQVDLMVGHGMGTDAILMLLRCLEMEKDYYKKVYAIEGPNSFRVLFDRYLHDTFLRALSEHPLQHRENIPALSHELIADYFASGLSHLIEEWIFGRIRCSADELHEVYKYLLAHSVYDLLS